MRAFLSLSLHTHTHTHSLSLPPQTPATERAEVLESKTTAAEWKIELERVLPQLKVHIRSDAKNWRSHLQQMQDNKKQIESALQDTTVSVCVCACVCACVSVYVFVFSSLLREVF